MTPVELAKLNGFRVLVTGARDWQDKSKVRNALDAVGMAWGFDGMTVVEGMCPYGGADEIAYQWVLDNADLGVRSERHPADWQQYGRAAGPIRNTKMVTAGARICLAFPGINSRGTKDCMTKAGHIGIPVWDVANQSGPPFILRA